MKYILSCLLIGIFVFSLSENKKWVYFSNAYSLNESIQMLEKFDAKLICKSNWLKAATFDLTDYQISQIKALEYVTKIEKCVSLQKQVTNYTAFETNDQINQLNGSFLLKKGLTGQGIKIGIIDGGFSYADTLEYFHHLFSNNLVKASNDFIDIDSMDFYKPKTSSDIHGTNVWKLIGGIDTTKKQLLGLATGAEYYLARTEIGNQELKIEEDKWIEAIEWMHANGVKIVNSSLGYSDQFDNKKDNHSVLDMNGKTTAISKAAQIATEQKGMLLVICAGNLGLEKWQVVSTPGDAKGVLTVGATYKENWMKADYSSIGPQTNDYLKPNVCSYSSTGTSFSSPMITGLAACLWQRDTSLTNLQIKKIIEQSSHLYPYGNNFVGYGVPNAIKAIGIIEKDLSTLMKRPKYISASKNKAIIEIPETTNIENVILYHKFNKHIVKKEETFFINNKYDFEEKNRNCFFFISKSKKIKEIILKKRSKDIKFTTLLINNKKLFEIEWIE